MKPRGATGAQGAVMAGRKEPLDSLDYFPTPPWATRALCEHALPRLGVADLSRDSSLLGSVWEPACGGGHMAEPLKEYAEHVCATDIFDYGYGGLRDFLAPEIVPRYDWVITNPPFKTALEFALRGLDVARIGVALLVRTQWIEGSERFRELFDPRPPTCVAFFVERVPMVKGRWDPEASTATSYAWFVWTHRGDIARINPSIMWIPPGCRKSLSKQKDLDQFGALADAPLLT
jgi:hypothetical protein